jgi:hypothetical protein
MKKHLTSLSVTVILSVALSLISFNTDAASAIRTSGAAAMIGKSLTYERVSNPYIGITPDLNAKGSTYAIVDERGKTIFTGRINTDRTFYIPTAKLGAGYFTFYINNFMVQQFIVR